MNDLMRRAVEKRFREQWQKLEEQAALFVKMGYRLDELIVVQHDDWTIEVTPKSALPEGQTP